jgi:hypothetical protein
MHRAAVEDGAIHVTLMQPAIERLFGVPFGEKLRMPHFDAIGELGRQRIEKVPQGREIAGAKGGGQLQPVLANTRFQRRQTSKNSWLKSSQWRSAA